MPGVIPAAASATDEITEQKHVEAQERADEQAPSLPSAPPFPTFENTPTLPQQAPGNGFESGRDSRAR